MMRWLVRLLPLLFFPFLLCDAAPAGRGVQPGKGDPHDRLVPGVIIVKLRPDAALQKGATVSSAVLSRLTRRGVLSLRQVFPGPSGAGSPGATPAPLARSGQSVDLSRIYYGYIDRAADPLAAAARVAALPEVEYAEPKYLQTIQDAPNDPQYVPDQSSYLNAMSIEAGWTVVKTNGAVTVADVDGGTYWSHEDLLPNLWINAAEDINHNGRFDRGAPPVGDEDGIDEDGDGFVDDVIGWNFVNNTNDPQGLSTTPQSAYHGTWTASMFGAVTNNGVGMAGTAWNPKVMALNAGSATSDNSIEFGYEGLMFAADHGARVINCSWGRLGSFSQFEQDVVHAVTLKGSLVVAAAGNFYPNDNDVSPHYPASFREVLAAGATNGASDAIAPFTDVGLSVEVFAPGVGIWGANHGGGYGLAGDGTSFSTPLTVGLASLLFTQHPSWTPRQVATQIRLTADPIDAANPALAGRLGHGRVNYQRGVTESHAGLEVTASSMAVSTGKPYLVTRDTLRLSVTLQNIMLVDASGLQFTVASHDGSLRALSAAVNVPSVPAGQSVTLPPLLFVADTVTGSRIVSVALSWTYGTNEKDAYPFPVTVFSAPPRWELQDTPSGVGLASVRAVNASVVWAAGTDGNATPSVVRTVDGGATWKDVTSNIKNEDLYCVAAVDSSYAWVGTGKGGIYATTNGGDQWTLQPYAGSQSPFIDGIWFFDRSNGFALGDPPGASNTTYVVLKTTNGGATWAEVDHEPVGIAGEAGWNNSFWWSDPRHGWFGSNESLVYRTTDGGSTWKSANSGSSNSVGVSFGDSLHGVAVHDDGVASYSTDGGSTWVSGQTVSATLSAVAFAPGTLIGWTVDPVQPYRTSDGGKTWAAETTFPFNGALNHVSAVDTASAWAATSFGQMLKHQSGPLTGVVPAPPAEPYSFTLLQNYPNPFNPTTRLSFELAAAGRAKLAVYDMLGRQVSVLFDGFLGAGSHSAEFNARLLASGVYFYRLEAGGRSLVRKMVLIR